MKQPDESASCVDLMNQLDERVAHVGEVVKKVELWLLGGLRIAILALAIFLLRRHRSRTNHL